MIIGIDASMINQTKAGIGYYAYSLINELIEVDSSNKFIIFTNDLKNLNDLFNNKKIIESNIKSSKFKVVEIKSVRPGLRWIWKVFKNFNKYKVERFISPSNLLFGILFNNTLNVIHDLAPIKYPQFFPLKGRLFFLIEFNILLRLNRTLVTGSESVKEEIKKYYSKAKVFNAGEGIHSWVNNKGNELDNKKIKLKYNLANKYFLSISTLEPRKNYENSIKAFNIFAKTNSDFHYIIAGKKGWFYKEIFNIVKELNLESKVKFLGYVPEEDLIYLIDNAKGFVYLSIYEGFGLPIFEALARNIRVLTSNIPVFKETESKNIVYADPLNINDIVKGLNKLKENVTHNSDAFNLKQLSWKNVALHVINIYNQL